MAGEGVAERGEGGGEVAAECARDDTQHQAFAPGDEIGEIEEAGALGRAAVALGQETAEAAIGGAVGRPGEDVRGVACDIPVDR